MTRWTRLLAIGALMVPASVALHARPAAAQHAAQVVQRVGPFVIHRFTEGGRFARCAASLVDQGRLFRISHDLQQRFSVSVPGVQAPPGPLLMTFHFGGARMSYDARTNSERAWAAIDTQGLGRLMQLRRTITIEVGGTRYSWSIGNTSMETVMNAVESCVITASGNG